MVSTLPPLPFSKKIRWALIHTVLKFTLVYASILFLSCWAWKLCIVWSPSTPGTHSDFYLNHMGSFSSSVPMLLSTSQGICTRCSSPCKPLHSSCLLKPISSFRYKIFQHFSRNTYPSSLWFGKISHSMAPLAGDAVLFTRVTPSPTEGSFLPHSGIFGSWWLPAVFHSKLCPHLKDSAPLQRIYPIPGDSLHPVRGQQRAGGCYPGCLPSDWAVLRRSS